jgi:predicted outer membrane repeat protein
MDYGRFVIQVCVSTALLAAAAQADTIYVDDGNCPGPGSGTEGDPYCSIQDAIDAAADTDEIVVAPGRYFERINLAGKAITLRGSAGPAATVIDAENAPTVVTCDSGEGPDTVLEGFTLTDGDPCTYGGGGMTNLGSSPTVRNCIFTGNDGGGMLNYQSSPTVTDCVFSGNTASLGAARGSDCCFAHGTPGCDDPTCEATVCGVDTFCCSVEWDWLCADQARELCPELCPECHPSVLGGGMRNDAGSSPTVSRCTFVSNSAEVAGGAIANEGGGATVIDCTFEGNTADAGGAIAVNSDAPTVILNCTFTANSGSGGAIFNSGDYLEVRNCSFVGNTTSDAAGAMYNYGGSQTVVNCTFSGNTAGTKGGAMFNFSSASPTVTNCTFGGNTAGGNGGAVYNQSNSFPTLTNCVLWGNSPGEIFDDAGCATLVEYSTVSGGFPGAGNIDTDPHCVDPARDNLRLRAGSPCIDAGDNIAVPEGVDSDLDGHPRFVDDPDTVDTGLGLPPLVDMGAYEFQGWCPCDCAPPPNRVVNVTDFLFMLGQWGGPGSCDCAEPADGVVNVTDFLFMLGIWGPCP